MKTNLTLIAFLAAFAAMGEPVPHAAKPAKAEAPAPRIPPEVRRLIHNAGMVEKREEGPAFCVVDFRKRGGDFSGVLSKIEAFTRLIVKAEQRGLGEGEDPVKASFALLGKESGAVVAVVDDATSPSLSVFPEDGVAVINVRKLAEGLSGEGAEAALEGRLARELWRAVAFVLGGYETEYKCVIKNIRSPKELDALPQTTCTPASEKVFEGAAKLGLARTRMVTYASAIRGGWAPPPTTDAQRKLVDYYKAAATNAPAATPPAK